MLVKREVILAKIEAAYGTDPSPFATDQSGYQIVNVGGAKTGGSATGLANDSTSYTASISINGVANPVAFAGSVAQTYTALLAAINADLTGAVVTISSGNLKVTSSTTGPASSIAITDTNLFSSLTNYASIATAVAGEYSSAILAEGLSWSNEGARMIERPAVRGGSLAPLKQVYGGNLKQVKFNCEIKGSGAAYSSTLRPEIDVLLRACALAASVVTTSMSESVTYKPASTSHESITIYYYQDGTLHKLNGCRGTVSFSFEAGGKGMANFTFTGHDNAVTDVALPTATFDSTVPPPVLSGSLSVASYSAIVSKLNFDLSNQLITPPSVNAADGYGEIRIVARDINGSIDPEHVLVATHDFIGRWKAGTSGALAIGSIGSTQYNRYSISMPVVYYKDVSPGDRDGLRTLEVPFGAVESSGDDEVSILFN